MPSKEPNKPSKAKVYSDEFKRSAVQLITEQKYSIAAAARAVGVSEPSLRQWLGKYGGEAGETGSAATLEELRKENKRLKRALKRAELEREILTKATAFTGSLVSRAL
jgi:transposase